MCLGSAPHGSLGKDRRSIIAAMLPIRDLWQAATLIVKRYGADAGVQAATRADQLAAEGDVDGGATWHAIVRAIEELGRSEQRPGEPIN